MKLTEDDLKILFHGLGNDVGSNVGVYNVDKENELLRKEALVTKQILENQKKAHNFDGIVDEYNSRFQHILKLEQENKELKEINQTMIENNFESKLQKERDNLKKKLEKIKELSEILCEEYGCREIIKEILDSKEDK